MACPCLGKPVTATGGVDARLTGGCVIHIVLDFLQRNVCLLPLHLCLYLGELYLERNHLLAGRPHFFRRNAKDLYCRL